MSEARPVDGPVLHGVVEIDPTWCTQALAPVLGGASVTDVTTAPVGTGQVADTVRIQLGYDSPGAGPPTLVAKVASASAESRAAARATRTYEIEVAFYRDLSPVLPVRAPRCYLAAHEPDTDGYVVLLEDLAPAVPGDQIAGCTVDDAAAAIAELPLLHGPLWNDPGLDRYTWLHGPSEERVQGMTGLVGMMAPQFLERYDATLDPEVSALVERLVPRLGEYFRSDTGPTTVVHGDYRLDNLLFGLERVVVLDWQTVSRGPALSDLSYFIGAGMQLDQRRAAEGDLVDEYRERLAAEGVALDPDAVWEGYRRHTFSGLLMAIIASMLVTRTDRGDEMFMAMANRHGRHALDLDSEALIPG
jgi:hypothetical protein